jgi:hypothetical protein
VAVGEVVVQEAGQLGELLGEVVGAFVQPVGTAQGCRGCAIRAGGAAEAQVDTVRGECLQRAELFRDDERRVVREHDAARAEADAVRVGREVGQDHGGRGGGDARHRVVLGDPVAVEAARLGELGDPHAGAQRVRGGAAGAHGHQVQYGEGNGGGAARRTPDLVGRAPDLVVCRHGGCLLL